MKTLALVMLLIPFWGCDQNLSTAKEDNQKTAGDESFADRFLKDFSINLVADGVSEQDAEVLRTGAQNKIQSLSLVNIDLNDQDRVAELGLQGALAAMSSVKLADQHVILYAACAARLVEADEKAIASVEDLTRYYTEDQVMLVPVGGAIYRLQELLGKYDSQYKQSQLVTKVVKAIKTAAYDQGSSPEDRFYQQIERTTESYFAAKFSDEAQVSEGSFAASAEPFVKSLSEVFDFTQETFKLTTIVSRIGVGVRKMVATANTTYQDEYKRFEDELVKQAEDQIAVIYGDSTEALEISTQLGDELTQAVEQVKLEPVATTSETVNDDGKTTSSLPGSSL